MSLQHGFIGQIEVEKAREEFSSTYICSDGSFWKKNIFCERPHTGNIIKGCEYDDIEELLGYYTESFLDTFNTKKDIELFEEKTYELDADIKNEILAILAENKTAYMLDDNVSDDKNMLISDRVTDGQETLFFTTEEAWEELNKDYDKVNETLVIWLLRL